MKKNKTGDMATYLFHEGTNFKAYEYMGAHKINEAGKDMYVFRTWAPNAETVFIAGDFNSWQADMPMKKITDQGIWEIKVKAEIFEENFKYKYIVKSSAGEIYKADPYAFYSEHAPNTASVFYDISGFEWKDSRWLTSRKKKITEGDYSVPMNIYEVHCGSWKKHGDGSVLGYRELAHELAEYVKQMGYTHVELMPVAEYPYDGSWGYQVCGYYAPTSRFGTPHDFMYFVDYMHRSGIGVILDWVPAHFPKDEHGLYEFDGAPLYEYQGADKMENRGWGTRRFDVGRNEVESFLISNAMYWLREYHVDGLRVDAVASMLYLDYDKQPGEWLPNAYGGKECLEAIAFFRKLGDVIRAEFPDSLFIAEESTAWAKVSKPASQDGLGFNFKWNMGWMNDSLDYFSTDPLFRKYKHDKLTFSMMYAFSENYVLPVSHDEVVHGKRSLLDKMSGEYEQKFPQARLLYLYMYAHPGKKLLFMGSELGQLREWTEEEQQDWDILKYPIHDAFYHFMLELNKLYLTEPALYRDDYERNGFCWVDCHQEQKGIYAMERRSGDSRILILLHMSDEATQNYTFTLPDCGGLKPLLHTDWERFHGSVKESKRTITGDTTRTGMQFTLELPPFSGIMLRILPEKPKQTTAKPAAKRKTAAGRKTTK